MIRFSCDYAEGAHPKLMERLLETNLCQSPGYGEDDWCSRARSIIQTRCRAPESDVHFMVGGTQTNFTVIAAALRPYQGVIAAETGHIAVHETGAVEATGHKVLTVPSADGKLTADQVNAVYAAHVSDVNHEHMVQPGMVYISQPTENGTVYSLAELQAISDTCRSLGLLLFADGARLGCALVTTDTALPDLARLCDVFSIGGTKLGALFGEAVVIQNSAIQTDFRYMLKQRGGMLAKGRLLGIQFEALFEDGLYFNIARREVTQALLIRDAFVAAGYPLLYDSPTNQQFPILPDDALNRLAKTYDFSHWTRVDGTRSAVRFCTSWATRDEDVSRLIGDIAAL